jgi:hypothetical protein
MKADDAAFAMLCVFAAGIVIMIVMFVVGMLIMP